MRKIKRAAIFTLILLIALITLFVIFGKEPNPKVCSSKACFSVEIVKTEQERAQGLMNREFLEENSGMLFIFEQEAKHTFWMKDTKIPLDIIWIDKDKTIVYIKKNAIPCIEDPCPIYYPSAEALYVLELNAGSTKLYEIAENDKLQFQNTFQ